MIGSPDTTPLAEHYVRLARLRDSFGLPIRPLLQLSEAHDLQLIAMHGLR